MLIAGTILLNLACVCHFGFTAYERMCKFELGSNHNVTKRIGKSYQSLVVNYAEIAL